MVYDEPPGYMHPAVLAGLNAAREQEIAWCTNSGRDMGSQLEVLELSMRKGLDHMPVAIMACESLMYLRSSGSYHPFEPWNSQVRRQLRDFHSRLQSVMAPHLPSLIAQYRPDHLYVNEEATAFCIPEKDDGPGRFHRELQLFVDRLPDGMISRNGGWVAALPAGLGKGKLLQTFMEDAGYSPENVLAVGDHLNDVCMLDGSSARHVGCPADSMPQVVGAVRRAGGFVARQGGPPGTVEVLRHFLGSSLVVA